MVSLIIIILFIISLINNTSATCSYVANYRYSLGDTVRYSSGASIINDHCSSHTFIENDTTYNSHGYYCSNNQVFVNFFVGSECEGSPTVTGVPVTSGETSINDGKFSYLCSDMADTSECNNYFLSQVTNSSFVHYDWDNQPTECVNPGLDVDIFTDVMFWKALINVCISVEDENSEIHTCNETGGYQWYHTGINCQDEEPQLVTFVPAEGCIIKPGYNGTDDEILPYGKLTYCGDIIQHDISTTHEHVIITTKSTNVVNDITHDSGTMSFGKMFTVWVVMCLLVLSH